MKSFHAKNSIDYRIYEYILPYYAFKSINSTNNFQFNKIILDKINKLLNLYEGTHNFHNFTVDKKFNDPSGI